MVKTQLYKCPECECMVDIKPCILWKNYEFKIECPDCNETSLEKIEEKEVEVE
jgi:uncharacterized paraquat-inducible protein A